MTHIITFILAFLLGWAFNKIKFPKIFKSRKLVSATYSGETMRIVYDNGDIEFYEGSCTVWHRMPYMHRCSTSNEIWLNRIYTYIKRYGNPYPEAHKD